MVLTARIIATETSVLFTMFCSCLYSTAPFLAFKTIHLTELRMVEGIEEVETVKEENRRVV